MGLRLKGAQRPNSNLSLSVIDQLPDWMIDGLICGHADATDWVTIRLTGWLTDWLIHNHFLDSISIPLLILYKQSIDWITEFLYYSRSTALTTWLSSLANYLSSIIIINQSIDWHKSWLNDSVNQSASHSFYAKSISPTCYIFNLYRLVILTDWSNLNVHFTDWLFTHHSTNWLTASVKGWTSNLLHRWVTDWRMVTWWIG